MTADFLWCIFMIAGLEHVQFRPGLGAAKYVVASDIALSHSLLTNAVWGILFALVYLWRRHYPRGAWKRKMLLNMYPWQVVTSTTVVTLQKLLRTMLRARRTGNRRLEAPMWVAARALPTVPEQMPDGGDYLGGRVSLEAAELCQVLPSVYSRRTIPIRSLKSTRVCLVGILA